MADPRDRGVIRNVLLVTVSGVATLYDKGRYHSYMPMLFWTAVDSGHRMQTASDLRYVAHLDMLGMSDLAMRNPDLAWEVLSQLTKAKQDRLGLGLQKIDTGEFIQDRITSFTFSDTIIVFSRSDEPADTQAIVLLVTELFSSALHYCIPLRGGIAHGRFMFNLEHNLFAGPALVQAYRLSEEAQWLGLRVDQEVAERSARVPIRSGRGKPAVIPWSTPLKAGEVEDSLVIDWVETHRNNFQVKPPIGVAEFYAPFARLFGPFDALPDAVRTKYENTVVFINDRLSQ